MVRLIGAVDYVEEGFNVSFPKTVILSNFTCSGTWTFTLEKNNMRPILDAIFQQYTAMSLDFETDHVVDYCVLVTDNEMDLEFFATKCGIPAVRIQNEEYRDFIPSGRYLWNPNYFQNEALKKVNKIGTFLSGKHITSLKCNLILKDDVTSYPAMMQDSVKNVRIIGAVQYDDECRLNYSRPTKVILSDLTVNGTYTFSVQNNDVQAMVDQIYETYISMVEKYNSDNHFLILTDSKKDCEFFLIKCGIPTLKVKNYNFQNFDPVQTYPEDYDYILWDVEGFEDAFKKVKKMASFCKGRCMQKKICEINVKPSIQ